ncbi:MAG: hypothetical protein VW338_06685 [Rhodospirillaceae bacterium]
MSGSTWQTGLSILAAVGAAAFAAPASADEIAAATAKRVGHATINEVLINGRDGGRDFPATVPPGSPITVHMVFHSDTSGWCPKCSNQIVVGYARQKAGVLERLPGGKCVYSGSGRHSGEKLTFRMAAPTAPGNYWMIVSAPQAYNCTKALRWRAQPHAVAGLDVTGR